MVCEVTMFAYDLYYYFFKFFFISVHLVMFQNNQFHLVNGDIEPRLFSLGYI